MFKLLVLVGGVAGGRRWLVYLFFLEVMVIGCWMMMVGSGR